MNQNNKNLENDFFRLPVNIFKQNFIDGEYIEKNCNSKSIYLNLLHELEITLKNIEPKLLSFKTKDFFDIISFLGKINKISIEIYLFFLFICK